MINASYWGEQRCHYGVVIDIYGALLNMIWLWLSVAWFLISACLIGWRIVEKKHCREKKIDLILIIEISIVKQGQSLWYRLYGNSHSGGKIDILTVREFPLWRKTMIYWLYGNSYCKFQMSHIFFHDILILLIKENINRNVTYYVIFHLN